MGVSANPAINLRIRGPIARDDLPGLCERVCELLTGNPGSLVDCDVSRVEPDAVCVDALARLQLGAIRAGCTIRLRGASPQLRELVALLGLESVLTG
jgi:ABC-type transporter Mla MlaB component